MAVAKSAAASLLRTTLVQITFVFIPTYNDCNTMYYTLIQLTLYLWLSLGQLPGLTGISPPPASRPGLQH